jgi:hypothetical protein
MNNTTIPLVPLPVFREAPDMNPKQHRNLIQSQYVSGIVLRIPTPAKNGRSKFLGLSGVDHPWKILAGSGRVGHDQC